NGYMNIDNEKMSKSLGNFVLTKDLIEQHDQMVLRFFMLSVHYRNPINFTEELLEGAKNSFERIKTSYANLEHRKQSSMNLATDTEQWVAKIAQLKEAFEEAMDDDFNTANAISVMFDVVREVNVYLDGEQTSTDVIEAFQSLMTSLLEVLGIELSTTEELLDSDIEAMIEEREVARQNRDFERADNIRDTLKEKGILLEDTAQGIRWRRSE